MKEILKKSGLVIIYLLIILITATAMEENPYFRPLGMDEMIPYVYEDDSVTGSLESLTVRTEKLKENYSLYEAVSIMKELRDTVKYITAADYSVNYDILHDTENYEDGAFYKYMYGPVEWIERNVIYLLAVCSPNSYGEVVEIVDYAYEIGLTEMRQGCYFCHGMQTVYDLCLMSESFSLEVQEYLSGVSRMAQADMSDFDSGLTPEMRIPSEYLESLKEEEDENDTGDWEEAQTVPEPEVIVVPPAGETVAEDEETAESAPVQPYDPESMQDYKDAVGSVSERNAEPVRTCEIRNVYFTLDKNSDRPEWTDTGISMPEEGEIGFDAFLQVLGLIGRYSEDVFVAEDTDMVMFIAEGKPLVINRVEKVTEEDLDAVSDRFEKTGIKVMPRSEGNTSGRQ